MKKLIDNPLSNVIKRCRRAALNIGLCCLGSAPLYAAELSPKEIDSIVGRVQTELNVPGVALAVIKDGKIFHMKGYGSKVIESDDAVTTSTLFQAASLTKAFKTAALAILVDNGSIHWDDKVIDYLPDFRMYDAWVTREFTIRDLLTHRSGLPLGAGDLLQWPKVVSTPTEIIKALRYLKPTSSFRSQYDYDNLMYVVAGEVIKVASGLPWQDFVDQKILTPLGMNGCTADANKIVSSKRRAVPHMEVENVLTPTFFKGGFSVNCDISGMAKWAQMHLNKGKMANGTTLISVKQHQELWRPVTLKEVPYNAKKYSQSHFSAYGLGWNLMDFRGYLHVSHGGAVQGMTSHIAMLPEKNIAVIAFTNQWSRAAQGLTATILDAYASDQPKDYIDMYINSYNRGKKHNNKRQQKVKKIAAAGLPASLPATSYAGTYHDAWYGDIFVTEQDGKLSINFGRTKVLTGPLVPHQRDTFIARWSDRTLNADAYVSFNLTATGEIQGITMKAVDPSTDFSYDFHHLEPKRVVLPATNR